MSEQERKIIDGKVKSSGLNRTEFLIRALTNKPVTVIGQGSELLTELKRQGNNLNQLTKLAHQSRIYSIDLLELLLLYRQILLALEGASDGNC